MPYDEQLAERIQALIDGAPDLGERKMFGGIAFMVQGNMACGVIGESLMVRVGKDEYAAALERGAGEMMFTGRPMKGFVEVTADQIKSDDALRDWIDAGVDYAMSLPAK